MKKEWMHNKVIIIGAGGHGKVIADIIEKSSNQVLGFLDDNLDIGTVIAKDYKVIGKLEDIEKLQKEEPNAKYIIAIGNNKVRRKISEKYDLDYYTAIHPTASIAIDVTIGAGTVVMANVCVSPSTRIGKHAIINTGAIVEHDNVIEDFVHISPRAVLAGTVIVGENTHIGVGATVRNNITICEDVVIGAGAVIVKNIEKKGTYIGVPAQLLKSKVGDNMKVLQIVKTSNGANWAFEQAKWLKENGVDIVTVLPSIEGQVAKKYIDSDMKIIEGEFSLPIFKPWQFFTKRKRLLRIIEQEKPQIMHFHFVTNILFARIALRNVKIPRLFQVPGPLHLENKLIRKIEILLSNKYDYWAPSCKLSKNIYDKYVNDDKVFLAYYGGYGGNAIENYSEGNILHKQYNIGEDKILIGMVSYFYKPKYYLGQSRGIKGHEDFIDAISILNKKYDNIQAIIIGGPWGNSEKYKDKVKKYAIKKKINNIIFTGFRNDIKQIYKELNIAVHPSHSENLGGAAESLAAAVPTVSTNVGGFPDIVINEETGYVCESKNPKSLAEAIALTIDNYEKSKEMANEGQALVKKLLDINNSAKEIKQIYLKVGGKEV